MITQTLDLNNIERKIFWVLASALCAAVGFYMYSALVITVVGVDRENLFRAAHDLANKTGMLEAEYLAQSNAVTLSHAQELGFHEINAKFADVGSIKFSMAR